MADEKKTTDWTAIINSVKAPLGFFTLITLVLDAVLVAAAATTSKIQIWIPLALLGFLVVLVFVIAMFKPEALYHPNDWPEKKRMKAYLIFPGQAIDINLEIDKCTSVIRGKDGQVKNKQIPKLVFDQGAWAIILSEKLDDTDSVQLELIESGNRKWKTKPFIPYDTNVQVFKIN